MFFWWRRRFCPSIPSIQAVVVLKLLICTALIIKKIFYTNQNRFLNLNQGYESMLIVQIWQTISECQQSTSQAGIPVIMPSLPHVCWWFNRCIYILTGFCLLWVCQFLTSCNLRSRNHCQKWLVMNNAFHFLNSTLRVWFAQLYFFLISLHLSLIVRLHPQTPVIPHLC